MYKAPISRSYRAVKTTLYQKNKIGIGFPLAVALSVLSVLSTVPVLLQAQTAESRDTFTGIGWVPSDKVTVDPEASLTVGEGNFASEFNALSDSHLWHPQGAVAEVSGGVLFLKGTSENAGVTLSGLADGPDLDLGWNDFLEFRIRLPEAYEGGVRISYGSTDYPGFAPNRTLTIPAARIPADGAFHTFRVDMGLEPLWRSQLSDLRFELSGVDASEARFALDYVRVGDEPDAPVYHTMTSPETPAEGGLTPDTALLGKGQKIYSMESKRFRFMWNDAVTEAPAWTGEMPHGTLRNLEETWQVYTKKMGYLEPVFTSQDKTGSKGAIRGKINVSSWHAGYWAGFYNAGPDEDRARFNATPDGLRVDPPTWVIPHELMHDFQFFNTEDQMPGYWYEAHANYAQERWLQHYQDLFPETASVSPDAVRAAHQIFADSRYQYLSFMPFMYLDTNPDNLPDLGEGTVTKIWQQGVSGEHPFMNLDTILPETGRKDAFGYYARRGATLNYPAQPYLMKSMSWDVQVPRYQITDLVQRADEPNWWRVPYEMAPQQGAYTVNQLKVPDHGTSDRTVSVNFRGLPDRERGADWRVAFVIVADDGSERYSELWSDGSRSVTLAADENELYLTVAATPDDFAYVEWDQKVYSYRSHPGNARFPYEIQVDGAVPKLRGNGEPDGLVQHSNGGGWKARTANVANSAFVGPGARVLDNAVVSGNARVEDSAVVQNEAQVLDNAVVSGHAWIMDRAVVRDYGKVRDWAAVREDAVISGNARALEHADVKGSTEVTDTAVAKGTVVSVDGTISGNAIIDGPYWAGNDIVDGFGTGHKPWEGMPDEWITPLPRGLFAAYDFASAHDSRIFDQFGVTDGFTVGSPIWQGNDGDRDGVLAFNGSDQYVNLEPSVLDVRDFSFTAWIKPEAGAANQAVLWLGASPTKRLAFTPDNGSGRSVFSIINGREKQVLTGPSFPTDVWSHVAVTLNGIEGVYYINGHKMATETIRIAADQLLAPNTGDGLQHNYLARAEGSQMAMFKGSLDDVRFYSSVLSPDEVEALNSGE